MTLSRSAKDIEFVHKPRACGLGAFQRLRDPRADQSGYALPSLLLLVVVLSLLASAVLTYNYLQKQLALKAVHGVKAEYAAQSALAKTIGSLKSAQDYARRLLDSSEEMAFPDGSRATVDLERWGCYCLLTSKGEFKQARSLRVAVLAQRPGPYFDHALLFANTSHQLVLTGTTSVKGRIVTGLAGVARGSFIGQPGLRTPLSDTDVIRERAPRLPDFDWKELGREVEGYERLLKGEFGRSPAPQDRLVFSSAPASLIDGEKIPPEVRYVLVERDGILTGVFSRRDPLYIIVRGKVTFQRPAHLDGPVAVLARDEITVPNGVQVNVSILYSSSRIELKESSSISAQMFSPSIVLRSGSTAYYPSLLVSTSRQATVGAPTGIRLEGTASVEGTILSRPSKPGSHDELVIIQPGGAVTGAIYSENMMTLDGSVIGTVMTKEFYFYQPPTTYLGWLRSARIDRQARPSGYLVPIGFAGSFQLDILEWL